jgi:NAD(P)H-dependent FMN reductase
MVVLGFSSSPIKGGNIDRMVKALIDDIEGARFINLNDITFGPCMACADLCASDNFCKTDDDLRELYPDILDAKVLVFGTPSYFDSMNSLMAMFLERLWSFRHNKYPLEGKAFFVVSAGGFKDPINAIEAVRKRMEAYRARFIGGVSFLSQIAPCFKCGYGLTCEVGSLLRVYGDEGLNKLRSGKNLFQRWEDSPKVVNQINALQEKIVNLSS